MSFWIDQPSLIDEKLSKSLYAAAIGRAKKVRYLLLAMKPVMQSAAILSRLQLR